MPELSNSTNHIIQHSVKLLAALAVIAVFIFMFPDISHHLVLLIGAFMIFSALKILKRYGDLQNWPLEKATIEYIHEVSDEQANGSSGKLTYFYPKIKYQYCIQNHVYENDTVSLEKQNIWCAETNIWGETLTENEKWWSALKTGYGLSVYVNPNDPTDSVLIKNLTNSRRSHHLAILTSGILICFLWLLLVLLKL